MEINNNHHDEFIEEELDFRRYFNIFLHWSWLILLVTLIFGAAAYFISKRLPPYYQSSTTLLVNVAPANQTTDYSSVITSQQLTSTYAQMIAKDPVLSQVISQLNLSLTIEQLKKLTTITPINNTQLIKIVTETTNPQLSADIANAIATVFAAHIQDIQSQRFTESKATLEAQLADTKSQIANYEAQSSTATSADEKQRLDSLVTQYRTIYSTLLQSYETIRLSEAQSVSSVTQVDTAKPDPRPVKPSAFQNTLLAAMVGFVLVAGAIVLREALDDTIKSPEEIGEKFNLPIIGVINHHNDNHGTPITIADPHSSTSEAYRSLRTNINYMGVNKPLRTLMVTSSEPGEGKTTTLTNLAVVLAQNNKQVMLIDCDMRHPHVHISLRLNNRKGLSNLFEHSSTVSDGILQRSEVSNLSVVTSGNLPPNPAELLGSKRMQSIIDSMVKSTDMVLMDAPPTLAVTDAVVLAPLVDGVLVIVRPAKTRRSALKQTLAQLEQVKARVIGVVLNDVTTRSTSYSYHYKYYRNYAAYQKYYGKQHQKGGKKSN